MIILERSVHRLRLSLDADLYPEGVVFKCFYWYGGDFNVSVDRSSDGASFEVEVSPKDGDLDEVGIDKLLSRIRQDLIDFKTRDIVSKETRVIRELIVAKAFAHSDEFDMLPPGTVSDPVGFDPREYDRPTG